MHKTLSVNVLLSDDASVAEATGPTHNSVGEVKGKGAAKRHPKDSPDETVAFNLAVARALKDLAAQYEKRADEAMNTPVRHRLSNWIVSPASAFTYTDNNLIAGTLARQNTLGVIR